MKESITENIVISIEGYKISSFYFDDEGELEDVAEQIKSDIGVALADLGTSCTHGKVTLTIEETTVTV